MGSFCWLGSLRSSNYLPRTHTDTHGPLLRPTPVRSAGPTGQGMAVEDMLSLRDKKNQDMNSVTIVLFMLLINADLFE